MFSKLQLLHLIGNLKESFPHDELFNETYQIMMANQKGVAVNDFVLSE